jgi:hypothetical protein
MRKLSRQIIEQGFPFVISVSLNERDCSHTCFKFIPQENSWKLNLDRGFSFPFVKVKRRNHVHFLKRIFFLQVNFLFPTAKFGKSVALY